MEFLEVVRAFSLSPPPLPVFRGFPRGTMVIVVILLFIYLFFAYFHWACGFSLMGAFRGLGVGGSWLGSGLYWSLGCSFALGCDWGVIGVAAPGPPRAPYLHFCDLGVKKLEVGS